MTGEHSRSQHLLPEVLVQIPRAGQTHRAAPSYFSPATARPSQLSTCLPEVNFQSRSLQSWPGDEPRGGPREESGGDVHSAEGPRAAHAEKDGVKRT
ncbi:beta-catenin-interacting protein 1 isoform X2 [Rhinolophus ferrumequinum]|uniref:beta-catenin-interacting protein 1 isoform X2 n=1 Tax=Rhinolophus ferrumequinum TaxID=59479 RepID=UPI00140F6A3A|nr:beta-catenin-interacting protein 1 isoform X2 [Rhinolophus ferrumequinum]